MKLLLYTVAGVSLSVWVGQVIYARWREQQPDPALEIKPPRYSYFEDR